MSRVITLTTDFGTSDGYVASMKGVILGINPSASIIDISHAIEPQFTRQAAFILHTSWRYFPDDTIHLVVVDPGVGGHRKMVILKTPSAYFVAPDNGVLSYILYEMAQDHKTHNYSTTDLATKRSLPEGCEAISITKQEYWRRPVSATFHGRDIFAPVAAHLSMGYPITAFGEKLEGLHSFPIPEPFRDNTGHMIGNIIHIDRYGNLITNFRSKDIPAGGAAVEIRNQRIDNTSPYYAQGSGLIAVVGGNDYLELSVKDGSAADTLGARVGDTVTILDKLLR
jgi:S-adenosyl-L-methionine hydrolase (adenosine-forming)